MITNYEYFIASISKCGSSMMKEYLAYKVGHPVPRVHTAPPEGVKIRKAIFMFCDPLNTITARPEVAHADKAPSHKPAWSVWTRMVRTHFDMRGMNPERSRQILTDLFNAWYKPQEFDLITVRYETMWRPDVQKKMEDFFGFSFSDFPEYIPRETDWTKGPPELQEYLLKEFGKVRDLMMNAEDVKVWERRKT